MQCLAPNKYDLAIVITINFMCVWQGSHKEDQFDFLKKVCDLLDWNLLWDYTSFIALLMIASTSCPNFPSLKT